MANPSNQQQPLSPEQLTDSIIWLLSAGYTGIKAADMISSMMPNGHDILANAAIDSPEAIIARIESDPLCSARMEPHKEKLKTFLHYFIGRAKELIGNPVTTQ